MWAGYIVWGRRVGQGGAGRGLDGLAVASAIGALALAPLGVGALLGWLPGGGGSAAATADLGRSFEVSPLVAVAVCAVVALCSNVVPYALDQVVLARLAAARFALLSTLLPATATSVGVVALGQRPTPAELAGVGLVGLALAIGAGSPASPGNASAGNASPGNAPP
jgi:inner membrane transporter RhtA